MNFKSWFNGQRKKKSFNLLYLIIGVGGFLIATSSAWAGFYVLDNRLENLKEDLTEDGEVLSKELTETKKVVKALTEGKTELAKELENERDLRQQASSAYEKSLAQLSTLEESVASQQETIDAGDITKLINTWSPRVARLECKFNLGNKTATSKASGVVTHTNTGLRFITNKHVVEKDKIIATECQITFSGGDKKLVANNITVFPDRDLAYVDLGRFETVAGVSTGAVKQCSGLPTIGDSVVILGYPSVGAEVGITATEGIISGIDTDYYITSAKIEQGNSGGAAVSVLDNCLLGLPTLVLTGRIESLARILPL